MTNCLTNNKIELLAPAGNFEKLEIAIHYGADAVYLGGKDFSLRNFSENFTLDELQKAVDLGHKNNVKIYVACNIYSRNFEQQEIADYLQKIGEIGPDAVIVADPGILMEACSIIPHIPVHLSTQANTTNYNTVLFWKNQRVKRVNVARELSLTEIKEIASHNSIEIEAFVHGAMCISYSGRCLLSSFMTNRDSNRGMCSHPCRWKYAVVEELRPGEYMPLYEDSRGSYIFNSKDLCMIEHIPEMIKAGLTSLKIEGRMKGINYIASTVKVYREAIDACYEKPADYTAKKEWLKELDTINHRGYCTGFYFGDPDQISPDYSKFQPSTSHLFVGKVLENSGNHYVSIDVRNKFFKGDAIEVLSIKGPVKQDKINDIIDISGQPLSFAPQGSKVSISLSTKCSTNDLIRKVDSDHFHHRARGDHRENHSFC
ncbi:MAG: peptidase U32 [Desulfuromonadales bacterium C00003093]|nr:MAG: peptidase U32 [Desulfuromonadales bacterium C00003093]